VTRLAVMYVHGVEIADERFAETSVAMLREEFGRIAGVDPDEALVIRTAFWAPVYEQRQEELLDRMGGANARRAFELLDSLGGAADRGSVPALLGLVASGLVRSLPGVPGFHFPTLRWLVVHYLGDAINYQAGAARSTTRCTGSSPGPCTSWPPTPGRTRRCAWWPTASGRW
jgi:hypothetical protein